MSNDKPPKAALREALGMSMPPPWIADAAVRFRNWIGRTHDNMGPPFAVAVERMFGIIDNKMLAVAVELELPDRLAEQPSTAVELAAAVGANGDALHRMLRFLVSRDLFTVDGEGRYHNNAATETLRRDHPYSWRDWVLFFGADWNWKIWNEAKHAILTGESPTRRALGHPFFEYVNEVNPDAGAAFNGAMSAGSRMQGLLLQIHYDFSSVRRLCDVGGGHGRILSSIAAAHPQLQGVVYDLPQLADEARAHFAAAGLSDRCSFDGGSFFERVPEGQDLYTLQAIVHDWGDDACVKILSHIHRAMAADGKVLVIESVIPDDAGFSYAKNFDLVMLLLTDGGRERTEAEFEALFRRCGFAIARTIKLPSQLRIFELIRA